MKKISGRLWKRARWLSLWGISNSHRHFEDEERKKLVSNAKIMLTNIVKTASSCLLATPLKQQARSLRAVPYLMSETFKSRYFPVR